MDRAEPQAALVLLRRDRDAVSIPRLNRRDKLNLLSNGLILAIMDSLIGIKFDRVIRPIVIV